MKLFDGLPEPGPCDGCGASPCRCKPAPRPVPEPASAALRRLHERAKRGDRASRDPGSPYGCVNETLSAAVDDGEAARREATAALPALADLVKETEALGCHECGRSRIVAGKPCEAPLCRALAALRERLEAKP